MKLIKTAEHQGSHRYRLQDIIQMFGEEMAREGFDLSKEIMTHTSFNMETFKTDFIILQDDKFRVRPQFETCPSAII